MSAAIHPGIEGAACLEAGGAGERATEIAAELTYDVISLVMGASPAVPFKQRGKAARIRENERTE